VGQTGQRGGAGARWRAGPCGVTRGDGLLRERGRWPAALGLGSRGPSAGGGKLGRARFAWAEREEIWAGLGLGFWLWVWVFFFLLFSFSISNSNKV
jgi:hypothetical protein